MAEARKEAPAVGATWIQVMGATAETPDDLGRGAQPTALRLAAKTATTSR
jgi:hypothetical protein